MIKLNQIKNKYNDIVCTAFVISFLFLNSAPAETEANYCSTCQAQKSLTQTTALTAISDKITDQFNSSNFLSSELVNKIDSRTLGRMIVERLHAICDKSRDPSLSEPNNLKSEIIMMIPLKNLNSIIKYGFKNLHQGGLSGGSRAKDLRLKVEINHMAMGLPYSSKARELLPKYALQVFYTDQMNSYDVPEAYGDIMIRFKSSVKDRATWSNRDSLYTDDILRTNKIRAPKNTKCINYCESQIFGALDFSDVDSIILPEGTNLTEDIKKIGLPIYTYKRTSENDFDANGKLVRSPITSTVRANISKDPVYSPKAQTAILPINISQEQITQDLTKTTNGVQKNILQDARIGNLSTQELVTELNAAEKPNESGSHTEITSQYSKLFAELAARPLTKESKAILLEQSKSRLGEIRALSLTGLATIGWQELKPIILENLNTAKLTSVVNQQLLMTTAKMIALDHLDDKDVVKVLEAQDPGIVEKFKNKKICQREEYE